MLELILLAILVCASGLLIVSESYYIREIWARRANPNPITWFNWTIGAVFLVVSSWSVEYIEYSLYLVTITALTAIIFVLSVVRGKGRAHVGVREARCFIIAAIGAYMWYAFDTSWGIFAAAMVIDIAGWWPTFRGVRERPSDEPLGPWTITVWSAALNLVFATGTILLVSQSEDSAQQLIFALYYYLANNQILQPLVAHKARRRLSPAE